MKLLQTILRLAIVAFSVLAPVHAKDDKSDGDSPSSADGNVISTPTYEKPFQDAFREMMKDFGHMTSLTESFAHPLFTRPPFGNDAVSSAAKPFSTWGSFGSLSRWSPRYEVVDDAKSFQIKMDVPRFKFHEMKVELESGGRVLSISGVKEDNLHESSEDRDKHAAMGEKKDDGKDREKYEFTSHSSTSFQQKFTLDPSVDTSLMTANLVDGVLEIRAPRKQGNWNKKHIPITQLDEEDWKELIEDVAKE